MSDQTAKLSMLDEFGGRRFLIPAEVHGRYRSRRTVVYSALLAVFLALPWIRIGETQAVLLDLPARRFELFGLVFLSHDTPLLFLIVAIFALGLILVTSLWGRIWCGWACPQTVFIDMVYRRIEYLVEGPYLKRRQLAAAPLSAEKFLKYAIKWSLYLIFSSVLAHSLIAYFAGSGPLLRMMSGPPAENRGYFVLVSGITALLLFNFGWFREQFCIIMCPYGRFQSALTDQNSIGVVYDEKRGEPRRGLAAQNSGDCVSCNRCVQVCPTGIDIRNGYQMECIGCTACMDACDEIMRKVHKPKGLIRYDSASGAALRLRSRVVAYGILLLAVISAFFYTLGTRSSFDAVLLRAAEAPYRLTPEGKLLNHFKLHLHNQSHRAESFTITLSAGTAEGIELIQPSALYEVEAAGMREVHVFVQMPVSAIRPAGRHPLQLTVTEFASERHRVLQAEIVGPL